MIDIEVEKTLKTVIDAISDSLEVPNGMLSEAFEEPNLVSGTKMVIEAFSSMAKECSDRTGAFIGLDSAKVVIGYRLAKGRHPRLELMCSNPFNPLKVEWMYPRKTYRSNRQARLAFRGKLKGLVFADAVIQPVVPVESINLELKVEA